MMPLLQSLVQRSAGGKLISDVEVLPACRAPAEVVCNTPPRWFYHVYLTEWPVMWLTMAAFAVMAACVDGGGVDATGPSAPQYGPFTLLAAATDTLSHQRGLDHLVRLGVPAADITCVSTKRSREVGQGWLSTIWSTTIAVAHSCRIVFSLRPDLIVCNGPGVLLVAVEVSFNLCPCTAWMRIPL